MPESLRRRPEQNSRTLRSATNFMRTALFHNITDKPFVGYWNGRKKTFKPGQQLFMELPLAEHYAKHLTNQILIEAGNYTDTSPKKPEQVPKFYDIFVKCCIPQEDENDEDEEQDEDEAKTEILNRRKGAVRNSKVPSNVEKEKPQIVGPDVEDVDDDEDFEGLHDPSAMSEGADTSINKE